MEIAIIVLLAVCVIIGLLNLFKKPKSYNGENGKLESKLESEEKLTRETLLSSLRTGNDAVLSGVKTTTDSLVGSVKNLSFSNEKQLASLKEETALQLKSVKEEVSTQMKATREETEKQLTSLREGTANQLKEIREENTLRLKEMRQETEKQLSGVREDNEKRLTEIKKVVDEKLTETVNEKFTQSFKVISEQLGTFTKGIGEMKELATGVTNLNKTFSNVKIRGTWGEVSLDNILGDMLTSEQYRKQFALTKGCQEAVDFAIVLPGRGEEVYLPIDVKFPIETYLRMVESGEKGDAVQYAADQKAFENAIKEQAKSISKKYIIPPKTTDFAVMYLGTEGLYAEVLRNMGLIEEIQGRFHVLPAGPSSVTALINSLKLGFKTLAVEKSSKIIFSVFEQFKKDLGAFVENISDAQSQIGKAAEKLDQATKRTDLIQKRLKKVEGIETETETALI